MNELTVQPEQPLSATRPTQSDELLCAILAGIRSGDITPDKVAAMDGALNVVLKMKAIDAEKDFSMAFVKLKEQISKLEIYADKEAVDNNGKVAYRYCSEKEISEKLEPLFFRHRFATMFGQRHDGDYTVAIVTLMHEGGHKETREFSVRQGSTNRMKDATSADAGSTTSAWRHLMIKWFGLKSRIRAEDDARIEGETISAEQAANLRARAQKLGVNDKALLKLAGAESYETISDAKAALVDDFLHNKEKVADPLRPFKIKLWNLCATIRGKEEGKEGWVPIKAWLAAKKILAETRKINELTPGELQDVINKTEISLDEAK